MSKWPKLPFFRIDMLTIDNYSLRPIGTPFHYILPVLKLPRTY